MSDAKISDNVVTLPGVETIDLRGTPLTPAAVKDVFEHAKQALFRPPPALVLPDWVRVELQARPAHHHAYRLKLIEGGLGVDRADENSTTPGPPR